MEDPEVINVSRDAAEVKKIYDWLSGLPDSEQKAIIAAVSVPTSADPKSVIKKLTYFYKRENRNDR